MTNKINLNIRIGVVTTYTSRSAVVCVVLILIVMVDPDACVKNWILCYRKGCVKFYGSNTHLNQEKIFRYVYAMVSNHDLYICAS